MVCNLGHIFGNKRPILGETLLHYWVGSFLKVSDRNKWSSSEKEILIGHLKFKGYYFLFGFQWDSARI